MHANNLLNLSGRSSHSELIVSSTPTAQSLTGYRKAEPVYGADGQRVLIIGSSVAHGWKDNPQDGGYLDRSFRVLSDLTSNHFEVYNKAVPGHGVMTIRKTYPTWLTDIHPDVVVIAWGGLDDLYAKTPMTSFQEQVKWEIQSALAKHALVIVVTSPVSKASYTTYKLSQPILFNDEMNVAKDFHNENVHVFNVFGQMKSYLSTHHETIRPYMGDAWHPNTAGHELAAQLFINDWSEQFGTGAVRYHGLSHGSPEPHSAVHRGSQVV
ncbi:SGNH/GDSL hydrolase family protein [Alicyclobacillus dauci]|uniref:SGNH/GDSL hydrolase family protein n=1 Tax=Alicyclobacillus dauci TaxID=1475485 RepID=A0ABY6Z636_9BACL|nr:SGNH/GDSL hydrolase family protein [Alicyclobacillus dauci]WAH37776.1 SGNH/GDSL hydrolase family protein [Alicyclobacillus dauci]